MTREIFESRPEMRESSVKCPRIGRAFYAHAAIGMIPCARPLGARRDIEPRNQFKKQVFYKIKANLFGNRGAGGINNDPAFIKPMARIVYGRGPKAMKRLGTGLIQYIENPA